MNIDNMILLGDRILIEPSPVQETNNGFYLPVEAQEKSQDGVVVKIGDGYLGPDKEWKFRVSIGDKVLFPKHDLVEIVLNDKKYILMPERELIAVID